MSNNVAVKGYLIVYNMLCCAGWVSIICFDCYQRFVPNYAYCSAILFIGHGVGFVHP